MWGFLALHYKAFKFLSISNRIRSVNMTVLSSAAFVFYRVHVAHQAHKDPEAGREM